MSEIATWYDPVRFKYYLERGNVVEEVHSITRQYIEDLTAENAKLRDLMYERAHRHAIQHMTEDELRIVATNVLDENANLRRLMSTMRKTLDSAESDVCSHCDFFGNCADNDWHECEFDKRMRELGIGVSE